MDFLSEHMRIRLNWDLLTIWMLRFCYLELQSVVAFLYTSTDNTFAREKILDLLSRSQ